MENLDVKLLGGLTFRRSPRLSSSSEKQTSKAVLKQKETSKVIQQKRRSLSAKCASIKLSDSPNEQRSKSATTSGETSLTPSTPNANCMSWFSESTTPPSDDVKCITNCDSFALPELDENPRRKKFKTSASLTNKSKDNCSIASFIGDPIPDDEALKLWGWRYELKGKKFKGKTTKIKWFHSEDEEDETIINVERHYAQARIGNCVYSLGDCAFIEGEGEQNHVGKIVEFFQTTDGQNYFQVQWFYRIEDTVVQDKGDDKRRLFYSSIMNDNLIDCIVAKANVTNIKPRVGLKLTSIPPSDFYYDMEYCVDYSSFRSISTTEMAGVTLDRTSEKTPLLYDHRSGCKDEDGYLRVCQIPKVKELIMWLGGSQLRSQCSYHLESHWPYSRLWWDETISTVLTCPNDRSQTVLHPEQDRVLTLRECARLHGFPDYYQFHGTVSKRCCQIGNAVAVPVGRALGFALGMAYRKLSGDEQLLTLPPKFSLSNYIQLKKKSGIWQH